MNSHASTTHAAAEKGASKLVFADSIKNDAVRAFVQDAFNMCTPDAVHWCDGSQAEYDTLCAQMVATGVRAID